MEQKAYLYKKRAYLYKKIRPKKPSQMTIDRKAKKKTGSRPDAKFRKEVFSSPTSGYELHESIKFD